MSVYGMDAALHGIYTSEDNAQALRADAEAYAARFELTPDESAALISQDVAALLDLGAHPFLIYKMALRLEGRFSIEFLERYLGALQGHPLRDIVT